MQFLNRKFFLSLAIILFASAISLAQATEREKGLTLYASGDYKAAVEYLEKAVKADDKDNEAWRFLGMAYYAGTKDAEKAREAFEKSKNKVEGGKDKEFDSALKIISKRPARYTPEARRNGVSGTVILLVEFTGDGRIGNIFPYKPLPDGLTENSIDSARRIKFEPAVRDGKPVSVIKFIEYGFNTY